MLKDTTPEAEKIFFQRMMAESGERRFVMGCSMFDTAKRMVISSIHEKNPGMSSARIKQEIFLRFYGAEFADSERDRILMALRK